MVGAGYLGRFHAQKYASEPLSTLVGVVDPRASAREALARELGTQGFVDHRELLGKVDAVSVVTTTPAHFTIARDFLEAGAHVLVEKPITETVQQARELIDVAARCGVAESTVSHVLNGTKFVAPATRERRMPVVVNASTTVNTLSPSSVREPALL